MTIQKRASNLAAQCTAKMPRCQAYRTGHYYNDTYDTDLQCTKRSRFLVGGRYYCLRHAEIKALEILLDEDDLTNSATKL
jgi:hypothetical protein